MVYRRKAVQLSIKSFGSGLITPLSPDNEWVQLADQVPWPQLEEAYQLAFPSNLGWAGKPFRLLYGAQLIKQRTQLSDRELVAAIRDTPAYQYFIGLPEYQPQAPFSFSVLSYFRRRIAPLSELITNIISDFVRDRLQAKLGHQKILITDATAVPVKIKYPQDTQLLNQARLNLERFIAAMAKQLAVKPPRTYKRKAHQTWTAFSRKPRRWVKTTHKQIKAQLQYIRRDLRYVKELQAQGGQLNQRQTQRLTIIRKLYEQQTEMYRQHTHRVADRIVSLDQPAIRPIIRGKAKDPVEFGPKIDVSISHGVVAVERFAFNAFNESADLPATIDHYFDTYGTYPDEILADTLYRTRANIGLCADLGIKLSGPRLGRRPKQVDPAKRKADRQAENRRGEIEREFAFIKGKLGLDLVTAKTAETIAVSIDAAIVLANLERLLALFSVPISFNVRSSQQTIKIEYQVTVVVPKSGA